MSIEINNEIKENNKKIIKEAMEQMIKDGIISPKKIKINVSEEIKQINQNLKKICDGVKCETSYRPFTPVLDLFEVGLLQELDENKLTISYLEKFKSDISRVGSMITTNKPLVQAYKQEFKDINYKLVEIIEYIRGYNHHSLSDNIIENTDKIEKLDEAVKSNKSKIKEFQELINFFIWQRYNEKIKKRFDKILFTILLATSVITTSLGIKSCINDKEQNKEIEKLKIKTEWIQDIGNKKANTNTLVAKTKEQTR